MKARIYGIAAALAATAAVSTASAQNLEESVTVEGTYKPEIIKADRLPALPSPAALAAPESRLEYEQRGVTANFSPDALPMGATAWRAFKQYDRSREYLDLRLGSWLNSSLSAGVAAVSTADTKLGFALQHNSTSLWQAWKDDPAAIADADRRFRYDERINIALSHRFAGAGTLTADAQYHLGYFNYYGTSTGEVADGRIKAPTQTLNDIYASAKWDGSASRNFTYCILANARHFAYRASYMPSSETPGAITAGKGERETEINAGGALSYRLNTLSDIGAEVLYSGVINSIGGNVNRVMLKPAYNLSGEHHRLKVGMELAVTSGTETKFRIAPDVRFTAGGGIAAFTAAIGGGTHLRTLAWMHDMDYYANPLTGCAEAAYSPIDATLGVQLNPGGKWTAGLEGKWTTTLDETLGGLYQAYLNGAPEAQAGTPTRLHGFSISVNAGYDFCRALGLHGKASWQPQNGNAGILNGFDRPEFTADITAKSQPIEKLSLALDYNLRARRELLKGNVSRLNFTADYRITDRFSVGAELNNLLNRHESILPGIELEGFNAAAGVQLLF